LKAYLGIDIGGTKIAAGIVSGKGKLLASKTIRTPTQLGGIKILEQALMLGETLTSNKKNHMIMGVGVGAGGQIDSQRGVVVSATDVLPGWAGLNIASFFKAKLKLPTFVDNDVNALAMGEHRFGAAKKLSTVVFLALGTGVGGALLLDGKIHCGAHYSGGEFGHIFLSMDDSEIRRDLGGHVGTLESYVSGNGLVETWRELTRDRRIAITGAEISKLAMENQDRMALRAIEITGRYLGFGLASLANALDPDLIVIGGGMAALGDLLLKPARKILKEQALPGPAKCKVKRTALGSNAGVIGAASLAMAD
jgi:glucokinase